MSASLIGRLGSSAFRLSTTAVSMSLTGSRFSSESALGPSIMGSEDEAEQSLPRPYRQTNGRSKRTHDLTSSIVPRGTSIHRSVEPKFPPIAFDPVRLSSRCDFPGPTTIGRQGPSEGVSSCGDCATAPIDGIWREKIRGCSCTEANVYRPPSQYRIARTPSQIMMPQTTITNPKGS